jgi:hypothetical protein
MLKFKRTLGMWALAAALVPALTTSCTKELDQIPSYNANAEVIYRDPVQIKQALARLYATLAVSGQSGPAGSPDISGIDEGFSNYLRQLWFAQEVTTDEAIIGWNDGNLPDYNTGFSTRSPSATSSSARLPTRRCRSAASRRRMPA